MSEPAAALPQSPKLDESQLVSAYANFARVSCNPEELIVDFGLNVHPTVVGDQAEQIRMTHRVVMNHFTAKRLLATLSAGLQRHEQLFGPVEIDVRKRLRNPVDSPSPTTKK